MALVAGYVGMATGQCEMGAGVVIEGGWDPALGVMAVATVGFAVLCNELGVVGVLVASLARLGGALEAGFVAGCGLMAFAAGHRPVGADQREFGFGMIEAVDVCPGTGIVASFATEWSAIGALAGHAIIEFAPVRIFVASRARAVFELEGKHLVGTAAETYFMAIGARDGDVSANQGKARGLVLSDRERTPVKVDDGVARFAAVVVRRGGKLIVVRILVAIGASFEFHFIDGVFARGNMALRAFYLNVFALEGVAGSVVLFHAE